MSSPTAPSDQAGPARPPRPPRHNPRRLPGTPAFVGASIIFASLYLAAGAPTPLLVLFQHSWGFPEWVLTIAFAAYAVSLLVTLLVVGSLSDHLGRRPVLIGSLVVEVVAMVLFAITPNIGVVILARLLQGVATGAATSAFTASVVEQAPEQFKKLASVIVGTAAAGGLGLGALLTGVAVQFTAHASLIAFSILTVIMVLGTIVAAFSRETVTPRAGALRSLVPHISVPREARKEFQAAIPVHIAAWMLAGLFMGLVPTIILDIFHINSGLLNGSAAFLEPGAAAAAGFVLGRLTPRRTTTVGSVAVLVGTAVIVLGVALQILPLLLIGGIIGGVGFGASFSGALRTIAPLAQPHERAGLFAGIYAIAYLAFGVPSIIAGLLVGPIGLLPTILGYGVAILILAAVGLAAQRRVATR